jgi:hypothetical protein
MRQESTGYRAWTTQKKCLLSLDTVGLEGKKITFLGKNTVF